MSRNKGRNSTQKRALKAALFRGRLTAPCCYCRATLTMSTATLEHITPLSEGGGWSLRNLALSCEHCNHLRGVKEHFDFLHWRRRGSA